MRFRPHTVVVGRNNAGKSTVVEALRMVALVANRAKTSSYFQPRRGSGLPLNKFVMRPSLATFDINFDNVFFNLGEAPALIEARFESNESVEIFIPDDGHIYGAIKDGDGNQIRGAAEARRLSFPQIHILPQIGPVAQEENILSEEWIRRSVGSARSSQHFCNQLNLFEKSFPDFRPLVESSWPGLSIMELTGEGGPPKGHLGLLVKDGSFVSELAWMGHGVQMWMQTLWFLAQAPPNATVILDEPDVYLHPDLQRRLVRMVKHNHLQSIIATHSVEIMGEAQPNEILVIERLKGESRYADSQPVLQRLVDHIGSSQNVKLARLWQDKRLLLVEGSDPDILQVFDDLLFPENEAPLTTLPTFPIGGWGGWEGVVSNSPVSVQNYLGKQIITYCLLDSDYHTPDQIAARYAAALAVGVQLHIWNVKEIENFLLVPRAIQRLILSRLDTQTSLSCEQISERIDEIAEELKPDVVRSYGSEFMVDNRYGGFNKASLAAEQHVSSKWADRETKWALLPGKEVIRKLSRWTKEQYGVQLGPLAIARAFEVDDIPPEIREIIELIKDRKPFP